MKISFIVFRLVLTLTISILINTKVVLAGIGNIAPFIQGRDILYITLETLKLKGLSIKEEKGKIVKFTDENKLEEEDQQALKTLQTLWDKSNKIGRAINLEKYEIRLSNQDQQEMFDDITRIKRLHSTTESYIKKINSKPRSRFRYSFKAKEHILCSDLESHNLITPSEFESIKKRDRPGHISLLERLCTCSYELITREKYRSCTKTLADTATKTDADIFKNYTPTTSEIDTKINEKKTKNKGKNKGKNKEKKCNKEDAKLI